MSLLLWAGPGWAQPSVAVDLATVATNEAVLQRTYGYTGNGSSGVPVAGGFDCDDDGLPDFAMAAMRASPLGRSGAGEVYLVFGDGTTGGELDTGQVQARVLRIAGDVTSEAAGSEIWMDDVTGDGVGDLLIARQNYTPDAGRPGAGALTILVGGTAVGTYAATLQYLDLRTPPGSLTLTTLVGAAAVDRLGIWMRTGDVTGDGVADIVVGADQEDGGGDNDRGAAYVIRGGSHLAVNQTIDLADFDTTGALPGDIAKIRPPAGSNEFHFGATCQIADLDDNGTAEVLVAAALNRSGATLPAAGAPPGSAHGGGGSIDGTLYIAWDDNFTGNPWATSYSFDIDSPTLGSRSIINGGDDNRSFGEEILGGLDYDDDGAPDLFVGDIVGDGATPARPNSGMGHVLYDSQSLKGLVFDLDSAPGSLDMSTFLGGAAGDIAADTAAHGDFDDDGIDDLMFSSPHAAPFGRSSAGTIHVFFGQSGLWPALIDLAPGSLPPPSAVRIAEVYGANGSAGSDAGDTLCYSAAAGDMDGDGRTDIITNEMRGNGLAPAAEDVGNLLLLSGALLSGVPACSDSLDNDHDGVIDTGLDPGCDSAADLSERSPLLLCDDGADNDGDGRIDFDPLTQADAPNYAAGTGDPGCFAAGAFREDPQCQDGVDNDQFFNDPDDGTDFDAGVSAGDPPNPPDPNGADPQCSVPWQTCERNSCRACGLGFELAFLVAGLRGLRSLRRGRGRTSSPPTPC